jgi:hypothetical protein
MRSLISITDIPAIPQTCKALVLKTHQLGYTITDQLISWCDSPYLGHKSARGFELLLGDAELVLNKSSGAVVNVSYNELKIVTSLNFSPESISATLQTKIIQFLPS